MWLNTSGLVHPGGACGAKESPPALRVSTKHRKTEGCDAMRCDAS
eukprot:gene14030-biopygen3818